MRKKRISAIFLSLVFIIYSAGFKTASCEVLKFDFIPSESSIIFHADSTLRKFDGKASGITGSAEGDIENVEDTAKGSFEVKVASMSTDNESRDKKMMNDMEAEKFPSIVFNLTRASVLKKPESENDHYLLKISGTLSMHGTTRDIAFPATFTYNGNSINLKASVPLSLKDYNIKPSSFLFLKVKDDITIEFDIDGTETDV